MPPNAQRPANSCLVLCGGRRLCTKGEKRKDAGTELSICEADQGDAEMQDHQMAKHKSAAPHSNEIGECRKSRYLSFMLGIERRCNARHQRMRRIEPE